jgi:hypothetical protein
MANLKNLKGLFWKDGEAESNYQNLAPEPNINLQPISISTSASSVSPAGGDSEFYQALEKELTQAMPAEFTEFYNQMLVINEKFANLDDATRYQLAFTAAKTALKTRNQELAPADLIRLTANMTKVLDKEKQEFVTQNEQSYQVNLTNVQQKATEISQGIKDHENRLKALQNEIDAFLAAKSAEKKRLEDERAQLISQRVISEGEINQLQQKKIAREAQFSGALEAHRLRLEELKSKLENHLKNIK